MRKLKHIFGVDIQLEGESWTQLLSSTGMEKKCTVDFDPCTAV